tara:strand:- start:29 stop:565 length:537 start_codon:yes stop_codon:yes gene_type:complete
MRLEEHPGILVGAVARACLLHAERLGRGDEIAALMPPLLSHEFVSREFPARSAAPLENEVLTCIGFRCDPSRDPATKTVLTASACVAPGIVIGDIMLWIGEDALPASVLSDLIARAESGSLVLGDIVRTGDQTLDPIPLRSPQVRRRGDGKLLSTEIRTIQTPVPLEDFAAEMEGIAS